MNCESDKVSTHLTQSQRRALKRMSKDLGDIDASDCPRETKPDFWKGLISYDKRFGKDFYLQGTYDGWVVDLKGNTKAYPYYARVCTLSEFIGFYKTGTRNHTKARSLIKYAKKYEKRMIAEEVERSIRDEIVANY